MSGGIVALSGNPRAGSRTLRVAQSLAGALAELFGGLTFFADLPVWSAGIGALVAVLALLPLLVRRGR